MSVTEPTGWGADCDSCGVDAQDLWEYDFDCVDDVLEALVRDYEWTLAVEDFHGYDWQYLFCHECSTGNR